MKYKLYEPTNEGKAKLMKEARIKCGINQQDLARLMPDMKETKTPQQTKKAVIINALERLGTSRIQRMNEILGLMGKGLRLVVVDLEEEKTK